MCWCADLYTLLWGPPIRGPPPPKKEVFGTVCLSVCLFVCPMDYSKTCEQISTKFRWRSGSESRKSKVRNPDLPDSCSLEVCAISALLVMLWIAKFWFLSVWCLNVQPAKKMKWHHSNSWVTICNTSSRPTSTGSHVVLKMSPAWNGSASYRDCSLAFSACQPPRHQLREFFHRVASYYGHTEHACRTACSKCWCSWNVTVTWSDLNNWSLVRPVWHPASE